MPKLDSGSPGTYKNPIQVLFLSLHHPSQNAFVYPPQLNIYTLTGHISLVSIHVVILFVRLCCISIFCLSSTRPHALHITSRMSQNTSTSSRSSASSKKSAPEQLIALPSLSCSLSSLPQAKSVDSVSLHPSSMSAQRAAESEAKVN